MVPTPTTNDDLIEFSSVQPDDIFQILFTSGTTGLPKGAVISHFNYLNSSTSMNRRDDSNAQFYHRIILACPLFSAIGMICTVLRSLVIGATLIIPGLSFKATESLKAIENEK